jgi:Protein of unknown function (DUF3443)
MRPTPFTSPAYLLRWLAVLTLSILLAACGGGGDSGGNSGSGSGSGSGGNSGNTSPITGGPTAQPIAATAANTVPITVGPGAQNFVNIPNVTVTVCVPGTSTCQIINNIQLDTASYGLRLASDAAAQIVSALKINTSASGGQLAECTQFADGFVWGTVRTADVKIGGETASSIPIQVVGDLNASSVPATNCINGTNESTSADLGANGILGIGVSATDCGTACADAVLSNYYSCPSGTNCTLAGVPVASQVTNPVTRFAVDNNGVIVQLPPLQGPAPSVAGTLVFGIGTQSNNALMGVTTYQSDNTGTINGTYKGAAVGTFFDTGSNGMFFTDSSLPLCTSSFTDFYCPTSTQSLSATVSGVNGATTGTVNFSVVNAQTLGANGSNFALPGLAGSFGGGPGLFDFGLPFFFGRHVYYGFASASATPYVGF